MEVTAEMKSKVSQAHQSLVAAKQAQADADEAGAVAAVNAADIRVVELARLMGVKIPINPAR